MRRGWSGRRPTGIDRVCRAYVRHFRQRAQAVVRWKGQGRILSRAHSRRLFAVLLRKRPPRRLLWWTLLAALPTSSRRGGGRLYLNVGHTGLDEAGFGRWLLRCDLRPIYLVHDLIPLTHPEYCRPGEAARHAARIDTMLTTGAGVIANSHATLAALNDWAAARALLVPPTCVAWLGNDVPRDTSTSPLIDRPYFVTVGTIEGRKNHLMLFHLWRTLVAALGAAAPMLLVIGQRGWEAAQALALLDRSPALAGHVVALSDCDDATLARHLRHAQALLFPSHAEGFGLPLIEALAAGTPVVASDLPVFRELAGARARYLDPDDAAGWRAVIGALAAVPPNLAVRDAAAASYHVPSHADHFARVDRWLAQRAA